MEIMIIKSPTTEVSVKPKIKVSVKESKKITPFQNFIYNRTVHGLDIYTEDQVNTMNYHKKRKILKKYTEAQLVLNKWKQEMVNDYTNRIFEAMFPKSPAAKLFIEKYRDDTDPEWICPFQFKELGICKDQIIDKLIEKGILPKNFYFLKNEDY